MFLREGGKGKERVEEGAVVEEVVSKKDGEKYSGEKGEGVTVREVKSGNKF